jgi:Flp pilus assembly protein TadB
MIVGCADIDLASRDGENAVGRKARIVRDRRARAADRQERGSIPRDHDARGRFDPFATHRGGCARVHARITRRKGSESMTSHSSRDHGDHDEDRDRALDAVGVSEADAEGVSQRSSDRAVRSPEASGDSAPRRPRSALHSRLARVLWAMTLIAGVLLAVGAAVSRTLAVSAALLLAGCVVALLLVGVARGWEIDAESPAARRRVGVRTALRIGVALLVVSVACASAVVDWSGLAIGSAAVLCTLALVGGPAWLAGVAEAERDARIRSVTARK